MIPRGRDQHVPMRKGVITRSRGKKGGVLKLQTRSKRDRPIQLVEENELHIEKEDHNGG